MHSSTTSCCSDPPPTRPIQALTTVALIYDAVYPFSTGGVERRIFEIARNLGPEHDPAVYGFGYWDSNPPLDCRYIKLGAPLPLYTRDGTRRIGTAVRHAARLFRALLASEEVIGMSPISHSCRLSWHGS